MVVGLFKKKKILPVPKLKLVGEVLCIINNKHLTDTSLNILEFHFLTGVITVLLQTI